MIPDKPIINVKDYRKHLSPRLFWTGQGVVIAQAVCMVLTMFFGVNAPLILLSGLSVIIALLVLKPMYEGDPVVDSWKLQCFTVILSSMTLQLFIVNLGPILW